jgi:mono/diheme cytochrome c family protein
MKGRQTTRDGVHAREHEEPHERATPVPWLLGVVAVALAVWGVSYFILNPQLMSESSPLSSASSASPGANATVAATTSTAPAAPNGAAIFASRCASCHQATGAGIPGVFPPLAGSEWVNGDAKTVARILLLGITGKISVAGGTFNGTMPPFNNSLSDAEIAAVASHVRSSFGNKASAVTADLVKTERTALGSRATPWAGGDELKAAPQ